MHLAFIDIAQAYAADRPDQDKPFGGTNTAVCFLARALKEAGVACTLFNKVEQPQEALGIRSLPLEALEQERGNPAYTAFIFCGRWVEWLVQMVREKTKVPLIAWMHESAFNTGVIPALPAFDGAVFVSEWQQRVNKAQTQPHWKQAVIRNAMNPRFVGLFPPGTPILSARTKPPVLLYAGATPRGAFHLPPLLDELRKRRADFSMEVFCDCAPSADTQANAAYIHWMRSLPNVTHVGMVGQPELARRMKKAALFVAPNPWPETSCIALIEAMAAGLCCITTDRAALPETAAGFAEHIAIEDRDHLLRFDMPMPHTAFAEAIDHALTGWLGQPPELEAKLRAQIDHFTGEYRWDRRAKEWIDYLGRF